MERFLFSDSFSPTVAALARLVIPLFTGAESAPSRDELNLQYALTVLRSLDMSPLVRALSEATSLLSEGEVSGLVEDRDLEMDAAAAVARAELARKGKQPVSPEQQGLDLEEGELPEGTTIGVGEGEKAGGGELPKETATEG